MVLLTSGAILGQRTQIKGFAEVVTIMQDGKVNFGVGEQDLFITSEISNRISFLGETVFKFSPSSPTDFNVSVERIIGKYNYSGNHNLLVGKHHTPINYWNDTYHHGRVFFPTITRPLLFANDIVPIHTTGISFQGLNLGKLRFGYELMVGNGIGAGDSLDDNRNKSLTAALHIKPKDDLRIGIAYYTDVLSPGTAHSHSGHNHGGHHLDVRVNQHLFNTSIAYFGKKYEVLAENIFAVNHNKDIGNPLSVVSYVYAGIRVKEKLVPYFRVDYLHFQPEEPYYGNNNITAVLGGIRYEINYLAVVKLEYQYEHHEETGNENRIVAQFAVGF
ncbi:MAG: hypothetical protein DHS20C17_23290 [Cyclobacteriaceae bacterium]|nr:MAG: hypothetical protein DHS20C17_23290 [Cyclobacteriaceae bacterium]